MYFSMSYPSGTESEYNLPLGRDLPGTKSMAQSYRDGVEGEKQHGLTGHFLQSLVLNRNVR